MFFSLCEGAASGKVCVLYNPGMSLHSSIQRIPFTKAAFEKMQAEYEHLLLEEQALVERVSIAKAQGDLSENGAYKYGKIELSVCRRRLRELQYLLEHADVLSENISSSVIHIGNTVTLKNEKKSMTFLLVSKYESDPAAHKLSDQSPIGKALIGKSVGDTISVNTPNGQQQFVIEQIS